MIHQTVVYKLSMSKGYHAEVYTYMLDVTLTLLRNNIMRSDHEMNDNKM